MSKKLTHSVETLDRTTGEITQVVKTFSVKSKSSEEFFITFLSGLNAMCELSRPSDIKVLAILCSLSEYNNGTVKLTSDVRKGILDKLKISSQALSNSLKRLKEAKLVTGEKTNFEINPQYFWKGTTDERNKILKQKSAAFMVNFKYLENEFEKGSNSSDK